MKRMKEPLSVDRPLLSPRSLQQRYSYSHRNGMLDAKRLAAGEFSTNYEGEHSWWVTSMWFCVRMP